MGRRPINGIHRKSLYEQAKVMFKGKTAILQRMTHAQLEEAISTGKLNGFDANPVEVAVSESSVPVVIREVLESGTLRKVVEEVLASKREVKLSLTINQLPSIEVENAHKAFPILLALCAARVPVMLVGPAGSGKTSAASQAASSLGLPFASISVNPLSSKADFLGFTDANGKYHSTAFREMFENGGVFLLDEIDAGNPAVLTVLNAALANGHMTFANGKSVSRHSDCIILAAANTFGNGADRQYVGRNQLDAATLDRFFNLKWDYDESFELSLVGIPSSREYIRTSSSGYSVEEWARFVLRVRAAVSTANLRHVVSTRAILYGSKLLSVMPKELLEDGLIWKGLTTSQIRQVRSILEGSL